MRLEKQYIKSLVSLPALANPTVTPLSSSVKKAGQARILCMFLDPTKALLSTHLSCFFVLRVKLARLMLLIYMNMEWSI